MADYCEFGVIVGKRIKELREERGIPKEKLAAMIGVTRETVYCWEKGRSAGIVAYDLYHLAKALGVTIEQIVGDWRDEACGR